MTAHRIKPLVFWAIGLAVTFAVGLGISAAPWWVTCMYFVMAAIYGVGLRAIWEMVR